ncbi:MAG: type IV secretion system protein [Methylocystis sp.]
MTCTATSYGTGLIPQLLGNVDTAGCNYVQGAYQILSSAVTSGGSGTSVASLILILYVIFWAFGVWSGTATGSATDAAFRLFRAFVIYTLATSWNDFVSFAYTMLNTGPSAIGNALLSAGGTTTYNSPNAIVTALENIWNQISQAYQAHVAFSLFSLGAYLVGIACVVIIALFLAVATFTIILSKVFLWLLLGIAPLIILTLLFNASSRFFSGWLNGVVQYSLLQILVYAFLAFYLTVTQAVFANLATTMSSGSVDWSALAPFVLIGLTGMFLLAQLPALAASISGGMPMWGMTVGGLWR